MRIPWEMAAAFNDEWFRLKWIRRKRTPNAIRIDSKLPFQSCPCPTPLKSGNHQRRTFWSAVSMLPALLSFPIAETVHRYTMFLWERLNKSHRLNGWRKWTAVLLVLDSSVQMILRFISNAQRLFFSRIRFNEEKKSIRTCLWMWMTLHLNKAQSFSLTQKISWKVLTLVTWIDGH